MVSTTVTQSDWCTKGIFDASRISNAQGNTEGLLNRKGRDLLQVSQDRRTLTHGYISSTGHNALPHRRPLQHVCSMDKLFPSKFVLAFVLTFCQQLGTKAPCVFVVVFLNMCSPPSGHLPSLPPLQVYLWLLLGSKRSLPPTGDVASWCPGTSCSAATLGCNHSQLWSPSVTPGKFFFLKLMWSTRLPTRVVVVAANPVSSHIFRKSKQNKSVVDRLEEPTVHRFPRNCPGHSYRAELSGQGVRDQLQGQGRESFGWRKGIEKKEKVSWIYNM